MIKRMIQRQYDQLLETCNQTKAEIEYLNQNLPDSDFVQQLEIEKTQQLISSIEHDVQVKKQKIHNSEVKNRYQQLTNLYQQTTEEIQLLEATLGDDEQKIDDEVNSTISQISFDHKPKRERVNLSEVAESLHIDDQYEGMLKKWHESLNRIDELEEEQLIEELVQVQEMESVAPDKPIPLEEKTEPIEIIANEKEVVVLPSTSEEEVKVLEIPTAPILPAAPEIPIAPIIPSAPETLIEQMEKQAQEKAPLVNKKTSKNNKVLGIILNFMFYFILTGAILFIALFGVYSHDGSPRVLLGHSIMRVSTDSMSPVLPMNTLLITRQVDPAELEVGDIVTFVRFNETIITHRVYDIYENYQNLGFRGFRLIGDASNGTPDNEIHQAANLIGRKVGSNYPLGQFLIFVHHHFFLILILILSTLLTLFFLRKRIAPKRAKKKLSKD